MYVILRTLILVAQKKTGNVVMNNGVRTNTNRTKIGFKIKSLRLIVNQLKLRLNNDKNSLKLSKITSSCSFVCAYVFKLRNIKIRQ